MKRWKNPSWNKKGGGGFPAAFLFVCGNLPDRNGMSASGPLDYARAAVGDGVPVRENGLGEQSTPTREEIIRFAVFVIIMVICFASVLYALMMLNMKGIKVMLKEDEIMWLSGIFMLVVFLTSMFWEMGR